MARSYRLVSLLGRGGFGSVYRGRLRGSSGFAKTVAIKLLNDEMAQEPDFKARLRDEARLLALLRHRAIVGVEDLVQLHDRWAVVMEFVEGADLEQLLGEGPIPLRPLCEIVTEVASALKAAHEARDPETGRELRIVHRDIKPANIRLTPSGEVKILDFGVARASFGARESVTRSLALGSMDYMAPERFDGIDSPAADIYALGAVAYECVTGGNLGRLSVNPEKHARRIAQVLHPVEGLLGPEVGPRLAAILRSMLAYDRRLRPSAASVVHSFRELFVLLSGPWLHDWAAEVLPNLEQTERAVPSDGLPLETGSSELDSGGLSTADTAAAVRAAEREQPGDSGTLVRGEGPAPGASWRDSPPPSLADRTAPLTDPGAIPERGGSALRWLPWILGLLLAGVLLLASLVALGAVGLWSFERQRDEGLQAPASAEGAEQEASSPTGEQPTEGAQADEQPDDAQPADQERSVGEEQAQSEPEAPSSVPRQETSHARSSARSTGTVHVQGEVLDAWLLASDGTSFQPGVMPAGTYDLTVRFVSGATIVRRGMVVLGKGETVTIRCDDSVENCR